MNLGTPGLPVHHQLPQFTQTHVHQVGDAIHPSHPLSSPSPPAPNPSQNQGLFQWVNSSHEVAKVLELQLQHQSRLFSIALSNTLWLKHPMAPSLQWVNEPNFVWPPCVPSGVLAGGRWHHYIVGWYDLLFQQMEKLWCGEFSLPRDTEWVRSTTRTKKSVCSVDTYI